MEESGGEEEEEEEEEESSEVGIVEEREELMIVPAGKTPTLRIAHFLKPSLNPNLLPPLPPKIQSFSPYLSPPHVIFNGRQPPLKGWQRWVEKLQVTHESAWRKAGIFDAIRASTYPITRDNEVVFRLAERWHPETNTFVFPWGEATVTMEDVMILGGFSTLGGAVLSDFSLGQNVKQVESRLKGEMREFKAKVRNVSHCKWQDHFEGGGYDDDLEHAAFLALWLSRHVFVSKASSVVSQSVFPLAASLSCGAKIALAPVILASIYGELTFLKEGMGGSLGGDSDNDGPLVLLAPFQLVQLWAWERFPTLGPIPRMLSHGKPRLSRWESLSKDRIYDVGIALDSARDTFCWRPYAVCVENWLIPRIYVDAEKSVCDDFDEDCESFARCLRVCALPGIDCVELYLPHRVAMQFGMDQDIPCSVPRSCVSLTSAWMNYCKRTTGSKLYLSPRLYKAEISDRYSDWWNRKLYSDKATDIRLCKRLKRTLCNVNGSSGCVNSNLQENHANEVTCTLPTENRLPDSGGFDKKDEPNLEMTTVQHCDKIDRNPINACVVVPTLSVKVEAPRVGSPKMRLLNDGAIILSSNPVSQDFETNKDEITCTLPTEYELPDHGGFNKNDEPTPEDTIQLREEIEANPNNPCLAVPTSTVKEEAPRLRNLELGLLNESRNITSNDQIVQDFEIITDEEEEEHQNIHRFKSFFNEMEAKISELETTVAGLFAARNGNHQTPIHTSEQ